MILGERKRWRPTAEKPTGKRAKERWVLCDLRGIEVRDHAGFSLRSFGDIVVRCLLGFY